MGTFSWGLAAPLASGPTSALDFTALEAAIAAWLQTGTGLPAAAILKRNDKVTQPAMPYVEFTVPMPQTTGARDELRESYDPAAAAGAEVVQTTRGNRETTVSVQIRTAPATGALTARSYAQGAINALGLPAVRAGLLAAGLARIDISGIRDLSDRSGPLGAGRVQFDARFRLVDGASAATGYIDQVTLDTSGIT